MERNPQRSPAIAALREGGWGSASLYQAKGGPGAALRRREQGETQTGRSAGSARPSQTATSPTGTLHWGPAADGPSPARRAELNDKGGPGGGAPGRAEQRGRAGLG